MFAHDSSSWGSPSQPWILLARRHIASNCKVNNAGWCLQPISEACAELMTWCSKEILWGQRESKMKKMRALLDPILERIKDLGISVISTPLKILMRNFDGLLQCKHKCFWPRTAKTEGVCWNSFISVIGNILGRCVWNTESIASKTFINILSDNKPKSVSLSCMWQNAEEE